MKGIQLMSDPTLHTHTILFCVMFLVSQLIDGNTLTVSYLP